MLNMDDVRGKFGSFDECISKNEPYVVESGDY